ncbi:hypothetical protein MKW92_046313 [Papaver armeniacum]|nr:hypothetical protein MKW92_046313 [Papaver armeniacum]
MSSSSSTSSSSLVFKVTTVGSGNKALHKLLLKTSSLRNIPVVVMSSDECLNAGALKLIEKPVVETLLKQPSS